MTTSKVRPAPLSESDRAEVVGIKGNSTSKPNPTTDQGNRLSVLAAQINAEYLAALCAADKALGHAVVCGQHLLDAKSLLPHGEWLPWLEANTRIVPRQSQKYMRLAENWSEIEPQAKSNSYLGIDSALKLLAEPKPKKKPSTERSEYTVTSACGEPLGLEGSEADVEQHQEKPKRKPAPEPLPNTGCNYDPADPRGADEQEGIEVIRRRAWLNMARHAKEMANSFLAENGHRAIAQADATEIDVEVIAAVFDAADAWEKVAEKLHAVSGLSYEEVGRALIESEDA